MPHRLTDGAYILEDILSRGLILDKLSPSGKIQDMQDAVGMDGPELLVKDKPQITGQVLRSCLFLSKSALMNPLCREADADDARCSLRECGDNRKH